MRANQPIGIFDSGIGGLTVAKAVKKVLPDEKLIYIGDTAHLPYGDKSTAAIQAYSVRIADLLLQRKCKVILIACNSASTAAFELVKEYTAQKSKVIDVINPTIQFIRENYMSKKIGLIGTKQTVTSGVYDVRIRDLNNEIVFNSIATPLLVPMIEEGFHNETLSHDIIMTYLARQELSGIDALILGCTHYPIIKDEIAEFYKETKRSVDIIDSADQVAKSLKGYLEYNNLLNQASPDIDEFLVTDYTDSFEKTTKIFFGEKVALEKATIWEELKG